MARLSPAIVTATLPGKAYALTPACPATLEICYYFYSFWRLSNGR